MKKFIKEYFQTSIWSPQLDLFRVDESYDVRHVITNKKDKYNLEAITTNDFPTFFFKIKKLCGLQFFGKSVILGLGISFFIIFIVFISIFSNNYQSYLSVIGVIWSMFGLGIFFLFIAYPLFAFSPLIIFHSYNKKYLPILKSIFKRMQTQGYIEKDLAKYPESLQMAFWEYKWYDWHRNLNHYLHHWQSWYGLVALKYFFWAYNNLKFPIDEASKWNSWFNQFVSRYYMTQRYIDLNSPKDGK